MSEARSSDIDGTVTPTREEKRQRGRRNLAIGFGIALTIALIYAVTLLKLAASVAGEG